MANSFRTRIANVSRELALFAIASFAVGMAGSLVDSVFNNYLNSTFSLSGFQRSFLEFPRELPGFLVLFVSALLSFLGNRRLAAFSMLLAGAGIFLMGFAANTYAVMVLCLFTYSMGIHLFMPVSTTVGMALAAEGRTAQRLGQFNAIRNLAVIVGGGVVYIGFKFLNFTFTGTYTIAALIFLAGMVLLLFMKSFSAASTPTRVFLKLRKEYNLFYILSILSGGRKQIFLTFAPWVIVTIYGKPTQTIATLILIGGIIGILFQPFLGRVIDKLGEKTVLMAEALLFIPVCLAYGFSKSVFPVDVAFIITCVCYLIDQVLVSVSMARSTYMKKIALSEADVQPALSAALSIDHFFSIGIAMIGGVIWNNLGFQYVFLFGVLIAVGNFIAAGRIRVPRREIHISAADEDTVRV
jgi:predicted MFS family arabinose efflux permease